MARSEREVREVLEDGFADELTVCGELLEHIDEHMAAWTGRPADSPADFIILAELARSLKTARAALLLCRQGYGEQAAMLNRSLFEGMAVAHWVHANPEDAADRFEKHSRHTAMVFTDALQRQAWMEEDKDPTDPPDEAERRELVTLFGLYGDRMLTGHRNLSELVEAIAPQWTDETGRAARLPRCRAPLPQQAAARHLHRAERRRPPEQLHGHHLHIRAITAAHPSGPVQRSLDARPGVLARHRPLRARGPRRVREPLRRRSPSLYPPRARQYGRRGPERRVPLRQQHEVQKVSRRPSTGTRGLGGGDNRGDAPRPRNTRHVE